MNCETCNYKKAKENIHKGVIEMKPDCGYIFLINTEEYDIEDALRWFDRLCEAFPTNHMAILPSDMINSIELK